MAKRIAVVTAQLIGYTRRRDTKVSKCLNTVRIHRIRTPHTVNIMVIAGVEESPKPLMEPERMSMVRLIIWAGIT